jgi:hypothetical protein
VSVLAASNSIPRFSFEKNSSHAAMSQLEIVALNGVVALAKARAPEMPLDIIGPSDPILVTISLGLQCAQPLSRECSQKPARRLTGLLRPGS